jgi:Sec-independent protein translocase protein TatA
MLSVFLAFGGPGPTELLIIIVVALITFGIPIWVIRSLIRNQRENQKLRLEVGKLADEVQQIRKKNENKQEDPSS